MRKCCWLKDFLKVVEHRMWSYYVCGGCGKWYRLPGNVSPKNSSSLEDVLYSLEIDENLRYWEET